MLELWRLCDECNHDKWRAILAFVILLISAPFMLTWRAWRRGRSVPNRSAK